MSPDTAPGTIHSDRMPRRLGQLAAGLLLFGLSDGMLLLGGIGVDPWDVFHQGLSRHTPVAVGTWSILVGVAVLLVWLPLRQRPGIGTVANVVVVGSVIDLVLAVAPVPHALPVQLLLMAAGVVLNGVATALYIGAGLGPGPRDGVMTGIARRGHSIRLVRTAMEVTVLISGWLLGGTVGVGTVCYALGIGPITHALLPRLSVGSVLTPAAEEAAGN